MKHVIVIHEIDKEDGSSRVIGVVSTRAKALILMEEYYGKGQHSITNFKDIREDNIDFSCTVKVEEPLGGIYAVSGLDFIIDEV